MGWTLLLPIACGLIRPVRSPSFSTIRKRSRDIWVSDVKLQAPVDTIVQSGTQWPYSSSLFQVRNKNLQLWPATQARPRSHAYLRQIFPYRHSLTQREDCR
ncbi:hypothetical protein GALMADRAFT_920276 [Galerina marginata CBS 339.88]|uniref:Secreted protein n=1 Tax=Galerina marginata (strain CBS 339.88) TaxID=685588 RepID=A0A067SHF2_GALM3|nr:hypothetical protein GALMADRAFT_920276 [Galerina marginata CBS 339.88]